MAVAEVVAIVGKPGEDYASLLPNHNGDGNVVEDLTLDSSTAEDINLQDSKAGIISGSNNDKIASTPAAKTLARNEDISLNDVESNENGVVRKQQVKDYIESQTEEKIKTTPLAKKIAEEKGIDLKEVQSDKNRIYSEDVNLAIESLIEESKSQDSSGGEKLKGIRKISAQRLTETWQQVPMVTASIEVDVTNMLALCERINAKIDSEDVRINMTDALIKFMAMALAKNPDANVALIKDLLYKHDEVNISVAVAIDGGLTVPVIRNVDKKGLIEINKEKRALVKQAKAGTLKAESLSGGSMTISNIGMFGVDVFTPPIINMPESTILGIGRIVKKPVVVQDEIVIRPMMWLSLTFDHRALDGGVPAMTLLGSIRDMIEDTDMMIL